MIELGDLVRDKISGFEGVALAMKVGVYEPPEFRVHPKHLTNEGAIRISEWFEAERLFVVQPREPKGFLPVKNGK